MTDTTLVTGGNGFLGRYICARLAHGGRQVISYDMTPANLEAEFILDPVKDQITYVRGQVTDLSRVMATCQRYAIREIVHAAGFVDVEGAAEQSNFTYQVNTFGSIVMFEAACLQSVRRVLLISSDAVYQACEREPIGEGHAVFSPVNGSLAGHYGASKLAAEIIGLTYADQAGFDLVVLRPASFYGFGMQRSLYIKPFIESAVMGQSCHIPSGAEMPRDYTYVDDVAEAVMKALDAEAKQLTQRVFNVSGGRSYRAEEVVELILQLLPKAQLSIGKGLTAFEERSRMAHGCLDISQAQIALDYRPQYDLSAGLQEYIKTLRGFREWKGKSRIKT